RADATGQRALAAVLPPPDLDESADGCTRLRTADPGAAGSLAVCRRLPAGTQSRQSRGARRAAARDGEPAPGPAADAGGRNGLRARTLPRSWTGMTQLHFETCAMSWAMSRPGSTPAIR